MRLSSYLKSIVLVSTVTLVGCVTPSPLVRLAPASPNVTWVAGRASVQKEEAGIRVAAAFEQQDGNTLGFRVEIQNLREEPLEIRPEKFSFTVCQADARESCRPTEVVIDPEVALSAIEVRGSRERANAANDQALGTTLVLLSVAADLKGGRGDRTLVAANAMDANATRHDISQASLAAQRQMWSNVALRRNTIGPGMGVAGDVFIPIDLEAKLVWLHVRGEGWKVSFPFRQHVTEVPVQ